MKRLSDWLRRFSKGWVALLALVIFILFTALVLPAQSSQADAQSGAAGSPDLSLWYSPADLYRMAEAYGEQGRQAYIRARFTFDVAWPLVYTFFLVTNISWLYDKIYTPDSRWQLANLSPLLTMLLDFLENLSTSLVMARYPQPSPLIAWLAPFFTAFKWTFVGLSFLLLILGLVQALWKLMRKREKT